METNTEQKQPATQEILSLFNETLSNHVERLLGTRYGIEALPLNVSTISCLILLAARETEIESFPYLPPERYTNEKIVDALAEISLEPGENLETQLLEMIEKDYIKVTDDGRFFANKSTKSMSQLFERIFPQMPGLNLVAYLGQMLDEVQMGRKELEAALDQFDQMLTMQGVPLKKEEKGKADHESHPKMPPLQNRAPSLYNKQTPSKSRPRSLTSELQTRQLETPSPDDQTLPFQELESEESTVDKRSDREAQGIETDKDTQDLSPAVEIETKDLIAESLDPSIISSEPPIESSQPYRELDPRTADEVHDEPEHGHEGLRKGAKDETDEWDDEDIEKRIAVFEQELGLKCPICRLGAIQPEKTAKGKLYYRCSQKNCSFISWGKPYYLACPQCHNPFLIETSNGAGIAILKCPRATCHHWQHFPWDEASNEASNEGSGEASGEVSNEGSTEDSFGLKKQAKRLVRRRPRRKVRRVVRRRA